MTTQALALVPAAAPMTIAEIDTMATAAAKSGLFKGISSKESAFTLMMLCQAEGLHPIQALRRYHIIEGTPSMRAEAMLADFMKAGGKVEWHETTAQKCDATFTAPGLVKPERVCWTMEDAQRAELSGKPNWRKYPRQMLRARVTSEGIRLAMPEIVVGIYATEEVGDFDEAERRGPKAAPGPVSPEYIPPSSQNAPGTSQAAQAADVQPEPANATGGQGGASGEKLSPVLVKQVQTVVSKLNLGVKGVKERGLTGKPAADYVRLCRHAWISGAVGRKIDSTVDLSPDEAAHVVKCAESESRGEPWTPFGETVEPTQAELDRVREDAEKAGDKAVSS